MDDRPLSVTCACGRAVDVPPGAGKDVPCPACGKPVAAVRKEKPTVRRAAAPAGEVPQSPIPGYTFLKRIGQGGMGEVFLARQVSLDRLVAVKLLPPDLAQDRAYVENFVKEARSAGKLNHENITGAVDVGEAGGRYYFVMEYVAGDTLFSLLRKQGPLPEAKAIDIVRQVARGLRHAQQHGFVHRDIKPKNLLVTAEGVVKICDFGLARALKADDTAEEGVLHVTPAYASPEQCRADPALDHRTDVYSLGVTLFEAVTAKRPFTGATSKEILKKHLSEEPPSPKTFAPALSDGLCALILRMLRKKPDDRFKTYDELIAALEGAGTKTLRTVAPTAGPAPAKKPPVALLAGAGAGALALLLAAFFLFRGGPAAPPPPAADPAVEAALRDVRGLQAAAQGRAGDYAAVKARWVEYESRFRGTAAHPQFSTGLREFEAQVLAEAERVAAELAGDADASLRAGRPLAAIESLRRFPAAFAKLEPGIRIGTKLLDAERALEAKAAADLKVCRDHSAGGRFDEARSALHQLRLALTSRGDDGREEVAAAFRARLEEAQKAIDAEQALALANARKTETPAPAVVKSVPAVPVPEPAAPKAEPPTPAAGKTPKRAAVPHLVVLRDPSARGDAVQRADALKAFTARAGKQAFARAAAIFLSKPEAAWKLDGPVAAALAAYLESPALDVPADTTTEQHAELFALLAQKIAAIRDGSVEVLQLFACGHAAELAARKAALDPATALLARFGKGSVTEIWGPSAYVGRIEAAGLLGKAPGPWVARLGDTLLASPEPELRVLGLLFSFKEPLFDAALTADKWKKAGAASGDPAWQKTCDAVAERIRLAVSCESCAGQGRYPCGACAAAGVTACTACRGAGTVIDASEGGKVTCAACKGRRAALCSACNGAKSHKCAACDTKKTRPLLPGGYFRYVIDLSTCDACAGDGGVMAGAAWPCASCEGYGRKVAQMPADFAKLPAWIKSREGRTAWNALRWLSRHQSPDGHWSTGGWTAQCRDAVCPPFPAGEFNLGVTSVALLAYLGAGADAGSEWEIGGIPAGETVKKTVAWILARQGPDGQFASGQSTLKPVYEHLVALQALGTALQALPLNAGYDERARLQLRDAVLRGLRWAVTTQTKGGGWGYTPAAPSDSWVTSWGASALLAARDAGMEVPKLNFSWILQWYDTVTDKADYHIGYSPTLMNKVNLTGNEAFLHHDTLSAYGGLVRLFIEGKTHAVVAAAEKNVERDLPSGDALRRDYAYWWVGTFFLAHRDQRKGAAWERWTQGLLREILSVQEAVDTCALGSLAPSDRWSAGGGKAYAAAFAALSLEYAGNIRPLSFSAKK